MSINIPEHIIQDSAESALSGAFYGSPIQKATPLWWIEELDAKAREADAPKGVEKARLVRTRRSPTGLEKSKKQHVSAAQQAHTRQKAENLYTAAVNQMTPEQRLERLGLRDGERMDYATGEIVSKAVSYVEPNHFESAVFDDTPKTTTRKNGKEVTFSRDFTGYKGGKVDYNKSRVHFQTRNWDNSYRIVCTQLTQTSDAPDANTGALFTSKLTSRASGKIVDSGLYMQAVRGGFTTFATITFNATARRALNNCETTIGQQMSPFLDALGKMHKRGWVSRNGGEGVAGDKVKIGNKSVRASGEFTYLKSMGGEKVHTDVMHENERIYQFDGKPQIIKCVGASDKPIFDYVWVAEAPHEIIETRTYPWGQVSSLGHQNYHVHMLMRWNVEHHHFREWAARIESLWGKGFVKLERIKNANAAAKYLLKAVGYMTKGQAGDQGEIKGNRYNISKSARALPWENCATHEAQHMYGLIQEYMQGLEAKRQRKAKVANKLKMTIGEREKQKGLNKGNFSEKRAQFIAKLTERMTALEDKVKGIGREIHGNFARGGMAQFASDNHFLEFVNWAIGVRGWRLKTAFGKCADTNEIEQTRQDESAINQWLIQTQQAVNNSIDSLCNWYDRFERVQPHEALAYNELSLVTGNVYGFNE